jgi:hypothetical protein
MWVEKINKSIEVKNEEAMEVDGKKQVFNFTRGS